MANDGKGLGRLLLDTLKGIDALILQASAAQVEELGIERAKLMETIGRLVDENLDRADARYRAAAAALGAACGAIERVLGRMAAVAEAIVLVGQAVELAATLKP
jgi:hypothetical protein